MRASCEHCAKPQPADWRPGDLCIHCGHSVREEVRCYWCARWIPFGNFCRSCGAEAVSTEQYAPARVMKFYGADMFTIPKMLREMDPARIDTFRAIYGKHQAVLFRHVEDLRSMEPELFQKHWSSELEETLVPELPWPDEKLAAYSAPQALGTQSPFPTTRCLADLVALRNGDFKLLNRTGGYLSIQELREETALQLANWRVAGIGYLENLRYPVIEALRGFEKPHAPLVRLSLVYLGDKEASIPEDAITSQDPEISFFAALLTDHKEMLASTLRASRNPQQRLVTAKMLIRMKVAGLVRGYYRTADPEVQDTLIRQMTLAKTPVPELHDVLFETVEKNPGSRLARAAASALCMGCTHTEALRLAETRDWDILHQVALAKHLNPGTLGEIAEMLVREDRVVHGNFTWTNLSKYGRLPDDFVERVFETASTKAKRDLIYIAEKQLDGMPERPRGTSMERVIINAAFGDYDAEVIGAAWAAMHRINYQREYASPSPFKYSQENIEQFWPMHEFERRLSRLQANAEAMKQTFVRDDLGHFLRSGR
jgi:hypothetical protein